MAFKVKQSLKKAKIHSYKTMGIDNFARKTTGQVVVETYCSGGKDTDVILTDLADFSIDALK